MAYIQKVINRKKKPSFCAFINLSGYPRMTKTFAKYSDAKNWAENKEREIREGRFEPHICAAKYSLNDAIDRYLKEIAPNKTRKKRYLLNQEIQLRWWKKHFGDYKLSNISAATIADARNKLSGVDFRKRKPATVNRYLAALSHVYTITIKEFGWCATNPVSQVKKAKEPTGRVRFLSIEEIKALKAACLTEKRKPLYLIVFLAIATGARKNELLTAKIEDFNRVEATLAIYETKNSEARLLKIPDELNQLLQEWIEYLDRKKGYIFTKKRSKEPFSIELQWRRARAKAGLKDFRFHDLRHTHASYLAMNKASNAEISASLGHKDPKMSMRYAHLATSHTHDVTLNMFNKLKECYDSTD